MSGEATIRFTGNTCSEATLRFTQGGDAVASATVAVTGRRFDKGQNQYVDADTVFYRITGWRQMAEAMAETLDRSGIRVMVEGRIAKPPRIYDGKNGEPQVSLDVDVDELGPSIRWIAVKVPAKSDRQGGGGYGGSQDRGGLGGGASQAADDPWSTGPPSGSGPPF